MKAPVRRWPRRLRRLLMFVAGCFTLVCLLLAWWLFSNREKIAIFPEMMPGFTAREMCNCIFVTGQPEDFCRSFARQLLPPDWIQVDHTARTVTASWLGRTAMSTYETERYGCSVPRFERP